MEAVDHCNLCGETGSDPLYEGRDRLHGMGGTFQLVTCRACGLIYLERRPDQRELGSYYPADYLAFPIAIADEPSWFRRLDRAYGLHRRCREIGRRVTRPGRLLDVGCATGTFMHGMQRRGWEVRGLEPNARAAAYARDRLGLDVTEISLEEAGYGESTFDVVTLWDVLEHVPRPGRTLAEAGRVLRDGGLLVLSLPNPDSWERRWFGEYWAGWDIPRHFHIFSPRVIRRYLDEAGFEAVEISSFTGRHGVLVLNLEFRMSDWQAPEWKRRLASRAVRSFPVRVLTWPYFTIADRLNRSSIMTVFARRRARD